MTKEQKTAEKDLLKIIEGSDEGTAGQLSEKAAGSTKLSMASLSTQTKQPSSGKWRLRVDANLFKNANINRFLMVVLAVILIYFFVNIFIEFSRLQRAHEIIPRPDTSEEIMDGEEEGAGVAVEDGEAGLDASVDGLEEGETLVRDLFKPGAAQVDSTESEDMPVTAVGHLRLVGISLAENPQETYAMVENTHSSITFFLKKGETLDGLEVKDIHEDRVLFHRDGNEIELR